VSDAQVKVDGQSTCWDECRPTGAAAFVAEKLNDATQDDCSLYTPLSNCAMELLREVRVSGAQRTAHAQILPPSHSLSLVSSNHHATPFFSHKHTCSPPVCGVPTTVTHTLIHHTHALLPLAPSLRRTRATVARGTTAASTP
jgi:hypothetical protein